VASDATAAGLSVLQLLIDKQLSSHLAVDFNLRRYITVSKILGDMMKVERCKLPVSKPVLKAPNMIHRFQVLLSNSTCTVH